MSTADSTDLTVTVTLDMISGYFLGEKPWNIGTSMFFCTEDTVELEFDSTVITMKPTFNVA